MVEVAPLVVFSDDWGRHPSSCQHLIRNILPHRSVTWVNTIGSRRPRFDRASLKRGFEKLGDSMWRGRAKGHGLVSQPIVLSPLIWPSFRSRFGRGLNRRLLARAIHSATESGPPPIMIATLPLLSGLVGRVRAERWVYYSVDDYSSWPGLDGPTLNDMEAEFVQRVDVAVAVSETLQARLAKLGRSSHLLTHGVDLDHWRSPLSNPLPASLRELKDLPGPFVVYWGVIDQRMDVAFVGLLSEQIANGTILLAGPLDAPEPRLMRSPHVKAIPPVPFKDLPALARCAAVLIAPYADLPVTRAMQPLKLKEYLATSKPVVVRNLPATEPWSDCCDVVETPEAFAATVLERIQTGVPKEQCRARERLGAESWAAKAALFETWIDDKSTLENPGAS